MVSDLQRAFAATKRGKAESIHTRLHNIFVRRHVTRIPRTKAERDLPLQTVDRVKHVNMDEVRRRLTPTLQQRLDHILGLLYHPYGEKSKTDVPIVEVPRSPACSPQHAKLSSQTVVCEPVTPEMEAADPSRGFLTTFEVVEEHKQRLRLIHWTRMQNDMAYARGYACGIEDLISAYLDAVYAECAGTADIHASFYHVQLPPETRCFYRFRDAEGNLFQLRVGAMGHCVMPEVMHTITNVLAGNPLYVTPSFAVNTPVRCWIDNIRHHGSRALVEAAQNAIRRNAMALNLEVQLDGVRTEYDFIGVHWNHTARSHGGTTHAEKTATRNRSTHASRANRNTGEPPYFRRQHPPRAAGQPLVVPQVGATRVERT